MSEETRSSEKIKKFKEDLRRQLVGKWGRIDKQVHDYRRKREFRKFVESLNEKRDQGEITAEEWRKERDEWMKKHK